MWSPSTQQIRAVIAACLGEKWREERGCGAAAVEERTRRAMDAAVGPEFDSLRTERARLAAEVSSLKEQVRVLSEASLDLAGVALDRRAPGDRSTRGVRP